MVYSQFAARELLSELALELTMANFPDFAAACQIMLYTPDPCETGLLQNSPASACQEKSFVYASFP